MPFLYIFFWHGIKTGGGLGPGLAFCLARALVRYLRALIAGAHWHLMARGTAPEPAVIEVQPSCSDR